MRSVLRGVVVLFALAACVGLTLFTSGCGGKKEEVQEISSESQILGTWAYEPRDSRDEFEREIRLRRTGGFLTQSSGGPYQEKSKTDWRAGEWRIEESETEDDEGKTRIVNELVIYFEWTRNLLTGEELDITSSRIEERYRVQLSGDGEELLLTSEAGEAMAYRKLKEKTVYEKQQEQEAEEAAEGTGA